MDLVDICFNFTNSAFRDDKEDVVKRANQAHVKHFILPGSNVQDSAHALQLTTQFAGMYSTAGVHPHLAKQWTEHTTDQLRKLTAHENVVALGEAGLDFNRNYSSHSEQSIAFEAQLQLAVELTMPILLHQRDAHENFVHLLTRYRNQLDKVVVHCFTGTADQLDCYIDMDCHIGITGWICDERRGQHLRGIVNRIPSNRLMIETDAPYLLPRDLPSEPLYTKPKGRRNEPAYLTHIVNTVALCRGITAQQMALETTQTAKEFFSIT